MDKINLCGRLAAGSIPAGCTTEDVPDGKALVSKTKGSNP